jgi:hypothetical protein
MKFIKFEHQFLQFEHQILPRIVIPLLGGLFVYAVVQSAARADQSANGAAPVHPSSYVVNVADGYGVNDCIRNGSACARMVADAWCAAHGHVASVAYGRASDVTASIESATAKGPALGEDDVIIACGD